MANEQWRVDNGQKGHRTLDTGRRTMHINQGDGAYMFGQETH